MLPTDIHARIIGFIKNIIEADPVVGTKLWLEIPGQSEKFLIAKVETVNQCFVALKVGHTWSLQDIQYTIVKVLSSDQCLVYSDSPKHPNRLITMSLDEMVSCGYDCFQKTTNISWVWGDIIQ